MKRILFFVRFFLFAIPVLAQNTLTIYQKDGQQFSFGFDEKPVITYSDTLLVLKTTNTEVQYPLSSLLKLSFSYNETLVVEIENDNLKPQLMLDYYEVIINRAKPEVVVSVIAIDGRVVSSYKTDSDGNLSFSIASLPEGIYIIKSDNLTCKVLKK